jgi:dTMP kinase
MFITFEGIDGSGKTTVATLTAELLQTWGYEVLLTREPGGTQVGDEVREVLLKHRQQQRMSPPAELLLFCASRAQLVAEVLLPALQRGGIVLCDRFADSTLAYQGYGHGLDLAALQQILAFATQGLTPDLTLYLDLKPEMGLERRRKGRLLKDEEWNRLDALELAFYQRVYAGYEALISAAPQRWQRLDAAPPVETVMAGIRTCLREKLPPRTP